MEKIIYQIKNKNYILAKEHLLDYEDNEKNLREVLVELCKEFDLFIIVLLSEIANERKNAFWYIQCGYLLSFHFDHIDGAHLSAFYMFQKALKFEPDNILLLEATLDFYYPPQVILTTGEAQEIAKTILLLDNTNQRALKIVND